MPRRAADYVAPTSSQAFDTLKVADAALFAAVKNGKGKQIREAALEFAKRESEYRAAKRRESGTGVLDMLDGNKK